MLQNFQAWEMPVKAQTPTRRVYALLGALKRDAVVMLAPLPPIRLIAIWTKVESFAHQAA